MIMVIAVYFILYYCHKIPQEYIFQILHSLFPAILAQRSCCPLTRTNGRKKIIIKNDIRAVDGKFSDTTHSSEALPGCKLFSVSDVVANCRRVAHNCRGYGCLWQLVVWASNVLC